MNKRSFFKTLAAVALAPVAGMSSALAKPMALTPGHPRDSKPILVPTVGYTEIGGMHISGYRWCVQLPNGSVRPAPADIELHKRICKVIDDYIA